MGAIPLLVSLIGDPTTELETRENALKAVVNMALNCMFSSSDRCTFEDINNIYTDENEGKLYAAEVVPVLVQIIRTHAGKQLQKLAFMALVNLSANGTHS